MIVCTTFYIYPEYIATWEVIWLIQAYWFAFTKTYLSEEEIMLSESSNLRLHMPFFHDKFNTFIHNLLITV